MLETTVNIPFAVKLENDSNYFGYVDHPLLSAQTYARAAKAKAIFRKRITEEIEEGLRTAKNSQMRAIGCADGTVFIVRYAIGHWSYCIAGADRKYAGACLLSENTFDATYAAAKKHAEQNGGISWESSL